MDVGSIAVAISAFIQDAAVCQPLSDAPKYVQFASSPLPLARNSGQSEESAPAETLLRSLLRSLGILSSRLLRRIRSGELPSRKVTPRDTTATEGWVLVQLLAKL